MECEKNGFFNERKVDRKIEKSSYIYIYEDLRTTKRLSHMWAIKRKQTKTTFRKKRH